MILPLIRENWQILSAVCGFLIVTGAFIARTEEAVDKVPKLEKAILELKDIHVKQAGYDEGEKEGERKMLEKLCAAGKLPESECRQTQ